MLYITNRARPNLEPTATYLCKIVSFRNEDDWNKLGIFLMYKGHSRLREDHRGI